MGKIIKRECPLCGEKYEWDEDEGSVHFCQGPQKIISTNFKRAIDTGQLKKFTEEDARKMLDYLDSIGYKSPSCFLDDKWERFG